MQSTIPRHLVFVTSRRFPVGKWLSFLCLDKWLCDILGKVNRRCYESVLLNFILIASRVLTEDR